MNAEHKAKFREQLTASGLPVKVRFHGKPRNAPSIKRPFYGAIAFRAWGNEYVSLHPTVPLTKAQADALFEIRHMWDSDRGTSIMVGDLGWPFVE